MTVIFLTSLYTAAWRIMFLDYFWPYFARSTTIGSSVLSTCNSIGAIVWRDILFIYLDLYPEDTCIEASHAWVFFVELGGLRGDRIFLEKVYLVIFPSDILKSSHD